MAAAFILLWGDDTFQIQAAERHLSETLVDPAWEAMNLTCLDGATTSFREAIALASTFPFGPGGRLVVVRECPYFAEAVPAADADPSPAWQELLAGLLRGLPDNCHLLFEVPRAISAQAKFLHQRIPSMDLQALQLNHGFDTRADVTWLQEQVRAMQLPMNQDLVAHFFKRVGPDRHRQVQELRKLAAYAGSEPMTREMLTLIVCPHEPDVFGVLDAIGARDAAGAVLQLRRLLTGEPGIKILAAMATMLRRVLWYLLLSERGLGAEAIAKETKVKPGSVLFQLRKYPGWTSRELAHALELLLETDLALKHGSGRAREQILLEGVVTRLASRV